MAVMVSTEAPDSGVYENVATTARDLTAIVQELAQCCGNAGVTAGRVDGKEVLLDVEVGELRCILIRCLARRGDEASVVTLSPREKEIARMIAQGYPNKIIAAVLEISSWTVGTHVRHLFAKLQVTSRAAMVAKLSSLGMGGGGSGFDYALPFSFKDKGF